MPAPSRPLLTARQAECLRLVPTTSGSKEIATILGIEPGTVDQHIKAATKALGESSRHAAARKFAAIEAKTPIQNLDSQSERLVEAAPLPPPEVTAAVGQSPGGDWTMREPQARFVVEAPSQPRGYPWPLATKEKPRNDLTWGETLISSLTLSLVLAAASGAMIAGLVLLMRFLIDVSRNGG